MLEPTILQPTSAAEAGAILARAMLDDPGWRYVFPGDDDRLPRMTRVLTVVAERYAAHQGSLVIPGRAAAVWAPPGYHRLAWHTQLAMLPRLLPAVGRRLRAALRILAAMERHAPRAPHWYLVALGVDPSQQGQGLGVRLLAPSLARCDAEGTLAWLESTNPRNHAFYRRVGFEVAHEEPIPDGPTVTFFARPPRGDTPKKR